jgi:hypothetical protein
VPKRKPRKPLKPQKPRTKSPKGATSNKGTYPPFNPATTTYGDSLAPGPPEIAALAQTPGRPTENAAARQPPWLDPDQRQRLASLLA